VLIKYKARMQQQSRRYKWSSEIALAVFLYKRGHVLEMLYSYFWRRYKRIQKGTARGSTNECDFIFQLTYFMLVRYYCTVS